MRVLPRKLEASLGGKLLRWAGEKALKDSGLIQKSVYLPQTGLTLHYFERGPTTTCKKTLLFCHGLSDEAKNMAAFITSLDIPSDIRILVPDAIGHGKDMERAKSNPEKYQQPTPSSILSSTIEFLEVLNIQNCNAFGYSLGGALVYFLRYKRPDLVQRTVLVSPAIESCIDEQFVNDFLNGTKRHFCFQDRQDVKVLFRDLSTPHRSKKDPIPKFFLEAILRERERRAPSTHFEEMLHVLLRERGVDPEMSTTKDIDPESPRLVLWPDHDFICNYQQGKDFFSSSASNHCTTFQTISDTGHMFHSNGAFVLDFVRSEIANFLLERSEGAL